MKKQFLLLISMLLPLVSSCGEKTTAEPTVEPTIVATEVPTVEVTTEPTLETTVESTEEPTNYLETEYNLSFDSQLSDLVFEYFMNGSGTDGDQFLIKSDLITVYKDYIKNNNEWMEATLIDVKTIVGYINDSTYEKIKDLEFLDIDYRTSGIICICPQYQKGIMTDIINYEEDPLYVSYYDGGKLPEKCDGKTIALYYNIATYEFENGYRIVSFGFKTLSNRNGSYYIEKENISYTSNLIYPSYLLNKTVTSYHLYNYSISNSEREMSIDIRFDNEEEMEFYNEIKECIDETNEKSYGYYIKVNYDKFLQFFGIKSHSE